MKIALFLHIYQPATQFPEIIRKIGKSCYWPLFRLLPKYPGRPINLNIIGSLTQQFAQQMPGLLTLIRRLVQAGQIEFTGSAAYHPLLPTLPSSEILRQIGLNEQINRRWLGADIFRPQGFFPPEMAYSRKVGQAVHELGYEWILLDGSALDEHQLVKDELPFHLYDDPRLKLKIFFRHNQLSLAVAFGDIQTLAELRKRLGEIAQGRAGYVILAMDGETFGYHQEKQMAFLEEMLAAPDLEMVKISTLLGEKALSLTPVRPLISTWGMGVELDRSTHQRMFPRWRNPGNSVHRRQWQLYELALRVVRDGRYESVKAHRYLDRGLHSDQFWWSAHNPCWHPPMIERGAQLLLKAIQSSKAPDEIKTEAREKFEEILRVGRELYGDQLINC